jgi:hypothetical protein
MSLGVVQSNREYCSSTLPNQRRPLLRKVHVPVFSRERGGVTVVVRVTHCAPGSSRRAIQHTLNSLTM